MPEPDQPAGRPGRRTFVPCVLLGLTGAGLAAVAGNRVWVTPQTPRRGLPGLLSTLDETTQMPATTALALVVLAAWGVLLVTRGRVRRAVAVVALLAALGTVAAVVAGARSVPADLREELAASGLEGISTSYTGWFFLAAASALLSVLAAAGAVRWVTGWPQLGQRYDAPRTPAAREPVSDLDLWKAFDEGRDPTA